MDNPANGGNGHSRVPLEVMELHFPPLAQPLPPSPRRSRRVPLILLFLTILSTLAVGSEFARSFAQGEEPFSGADYFTTILYPFEHLEILLLGIPFSFTLLAILGSHELGHYFACKLYRIDASYPYFIPAPNPLGTFGAFIRIRSPITTRRALFDVGLAGPVVGFIVAVPAMAFAVATSKVIPGTQEHAAIIYGNPLLIRFFVALFHPGVDPSSILLHPAGRAAWVGLFATALNLLPVWQLDGGHILFSLASEYHRRISFAVAIALIAMGWLAPMWYFWGGILLILTWRFRHPPLLDRWQPLTPGRKLWAVAAVLIFALCFTPWPAVTAPDSSPTGDQARLAGSTSTMTAFSGISFRTQKSRQPTKACESAARSGDFNKN